MGKTEFDGSTILEKLALIGKAEEFFDVVDADDFETAAQLMNEAGIAEDLIEEVLKKMRDADGQH